MSANGDKRTLKYADKLLMTNI